MRALSTAASGMQAQQTNIEVIANNLANLSTTGFKRQRAEFQDLLYQSERRVGSQSSSNGNIVPSGIYIGVGVKNSSTARIHEQGNVALTGNPYDMFISGKGMFQITMPDGTTAYTRDGSFKTSNTGQLVTQDGYPLNPQITVPANATAVTISAAGQVQATIPGQTTPQVLGNITLAAFQNEPGLDAMGNNLFSATAASGQATPGAAGSPGYGTILQGSIETSNVNAVTEITSLIEAQRAYEMNSKVITTSDQMLQTINQLR